MEQLRFIFIMKVVAMVAATEAPKNKNLQNDGIVNNMSDFYYELAVFVFNIFAEACATDYVYEYML